MRHLTLLLVLSVLAGGLAVAADPPGVVHYQGVLRDASDVPQDGSFNMNFWFYDDPTAGSWIVCDSQVVTVTGGLFSATLGETANVETCMGAENAIPLVAAFAEHTDLYLAVQVNGEMLSPRIHIASSGYALNARLVRGREIVAAGPLDLYVDASTGDDANDGLSAAEAKATIQAAVDLIPPIVHDDVTVHVADGTYAEAVTLEDRLAPFDASITLRGNTATPSQVVITGEGVRSRGIHLGNVSDVTVEGFEIREHTSWSVAVVRGGLIVLNDLSISANSLGMLLTRSSVELNSTSLTNNSATGLLCQSASRCLVSDLTVTGSNTGIFASRSSYVVFNGPGLIDSNTAGCVALESGTIELAQRADVHVTNSSSPLIASLHGRVLGYANATLDTNGCGTDTYGVCRP